MAENNCVVCFKNVRIYSVGECDHPVCYECSTRMRVLCRQNECPMCRHEMAMVVFTDKIRPFRRLKRHYTTYDGKHHIAFQNDEIRDMYDDLLAYVCVKCAKEPVFSTFEALNEHMRKLHDLFCCDLCANNLKIFPAEMRYYTKSELSRHKRIGDVDDRSHRGHPLCEFCNVRYVDKDELYRHLRKEHLFCHICDSEGIQRFYGAYNELRSHYKKDHYLCEEGDCIQEQLTSVFPNELDLKAHKALVHCKNLRSRQAIKQARTLDLEITLVPRNDRRGRPLNPDQLNEPSTSHQNYDQSNENYENVMASWEQDFPSLSNSSSTYVAPRSRMVRESNNRLAFNEQNFPALGSETNVKIDFADGGNRSSSSALSTNISVEISQKKKAKSQRKAPPAPSTLSLTWVNKAKEKKLPVTRAVETNTANEVTKKPPTLNGTNFPSLGEGSSSSVESSSKSSKKTSVVVRTNRNESASPKPNYRKAVNAKNNVKEEKKGNANKTKEKTDEEAHSSNKDKKSHGFLLNANRKKVKMKPEEFVSLNDHLSRTNAQFKHSEMKDSSKIQSAQLNAAACDKTDSNNRNVEKSKSKENLKSLESCASKNNKGKENKASNVDRVNGVEKERQGNVSSKDHARKNAADVTLKSSSNRKRGEDNATKKSIKRESEPNANLSKKFDLIEVDNAENVEIPTRVVLNPPPGFNGLKNVLPPPPGFGALQNGSSEANTDGFLCNSMCDMLLVYQQPEDFATRNQSLIEKMTNSLKESTDEALNEFKSTSLLFREGFLSASQFYWYCREKINEDCFEEVFVDLVTLLPNISKQQELWAVHGLAAPSLSNTSSVRICPVCFQILKFDDAMTHYAKHGVMTN